MVYEVWLLGYNEDDSVNDFEQLEGTFEDEDKAVWFATHYPFEKPTITPKAVVRVEYVNEDTCCCEEVVTEHELD